MSSVQLLIGESKKMIKGEKDNVSKGNCGRMENFY